MRDLTTPEAMVEMAAQMGLPEKAGLLLIQIMDKDIVHGHSGKQVVPYTPEEAEDHRDFVTIDGV